MRQNRTPTGRLRALRRRIERGLPLAVKIMLPMAVTTAVVAAGVGIALVRTSSGRPLDGLGARVAFIVVLGAVLGLSAVFVIVHLVVLRRAEARTRQQSAVAELGRLALSGASEADLLDEATRLVHAGLDVDQAEILAGPRSPHDREEGAAAVPIPGPDGPFGLLVVKGGSDLGPDDLLFLRSMSGSLGWAIDAQRTRRRLSDAEARYRNLVERIPAVTYVAEFGHTGRWHYVSPQIGSLLGFPPEEWIEDPTMWYRHLHPEDRERAVAEETESRRHGRPLSSEYRMVARDGKVVWFRDEAAVVPDDSGTPHLLQGVMYDVSERKAGELAFAAAFEKERQAVERLRSVDEMKNAFLSAVSHELRTPLSSVLGYARTLQQEEIKLPAEERRALFDRLLANARKLERLLSDLLDLDRLGRGIVEPRRREVDLGELVRRVSEETDMSGHRLEVDAPSVMASVDPAQVERILENLLVNAAKHTPPGSPVFVRVEAAAGGALIMVDDGGRGVPDESKERVFRPFERGSERSSAGTGIGLSLVARFADLHGGKAWVEDLPGGGSSFRVFLPSRPPASEPEELRPAVGR